MSRDEATLKFTATAPRFRGLPFALKEAAHRLGVDIVIFEHDKGWFMDSVFVKLKGDYTQLRKLKNWVESIK